MSTKNDNNPYIYVGGGKRYLTQNYMLRERFGCKVMKISLNAGFTCPNIDGTKGLGGCTYCSEGSGTFAGDPEKSIAEQFFDVRRKMNEKWSSGKYIPYFQANTNTYGPLDKIRKMTEEALALPDVCGLAISTRPDCISEETADHLAELSERTYLTVELGLQTIHDETAIRINRCHTYADFLAGYEKLHSRGINICVHIIDGLPGETKEMMLDTVKELSKLKLHGIKLHLLHIVRGTAMAEEYLRGEFTLPTLEEYVDIICDQLELMPHDVCIERLTGDGAADTLIAPLWSRKKFVVMNEIDKEMRRRDSWQGKKYAADRHDMG
ncbi:MAG: TIGR01212 family radical SAM protein [Oscillospiraceae bacterium]